MIAMLAIGIASMVANAYSTNQQTKAANQAAQYNAEMMKRNADAANMQAANAIERGEVEDVSAA